MPLPVPEDLRTGSFDRQQFETKLSETVSNSSVGRRLGHSKASLTWVLGVHILGGFFLQISRVLDVRGDLMCVRSKAMLAATAVAAMALSACGQIEMLKARKAFKDANTSYQARPRRKRTRK
jgi:hypothetical protein